MTLPDIGILGRLRSGKNAVSDYLTSKYGYTAFAFGDELKAEFHRTYPDIPRDPKPRAGYQEYGQRIRRERGESIWINACLGAIDYQRRYAAYEQRPFRAVIGDVRQPNEYQALKSAGYLLIRVEAPDAVRIDRAIKSGDKFDYSDLVHGTETALDGFAADYTVDNGGTLDELYAQIDEIMAYLNRGAAA